MDENNTEMNGIGKEESAFVSELEEAIGLPEKENASGAAEPESMKNKKSAVASVFDIVEMFSICAAVILLLFTFAVRLTVVDGPSMQNTLVAGDYLLVQELGYKYERGDIIVVQDPSAFGYTKPLVKRLIAVGGDTVDIDDHVELDPQTGEKKYVFTVKVNGEILDESAYIHLDEENYAKISTYSFPITVEEGKIFVLGDNRYHSADSRVGVIGQIDERCVVGHAVMRVLPFDRIKVFGLIAVHERKTMPSQNIQWFPGHMAKTRRLIGENLKLVDIVIELCDARIPRSSRNPEIETLCRAKPRLTLLTKSSLASPEATKEWIPRTVSARCERHGDRFPERIRDIADRAEGERDPLRKDKKI